MASRIAAFLMIAALQDVELASYLHWKVAGQTTEGGNRTFGLV